MTGNLSSLALPPDELCLLTLGPGCGECVIVRVPPNQFLVVDSFLRPRTSSGTNPALEFVRRLGGEISCAVLTHPHADHAEGFDLVAGDCTGPVGLVEKFLPSGASKTDTQANLELGLTQYALNAIKSRWDKDDVHKFPLTAGETRSIGAASITVLHPCQDTLKSTSGPNDLSSPLLIHWEQVSLLLGADLPTRYWPKVGQNFGIKGATGFKLPHHASKNGYCQTEHVPGHRGAFWVATPYKRKPQPPRFEDGEAVAQILEAVDELVLCSTLLPHVADPHSSCVTRAARSDGRQCRSQRGATWRYASNFSRTSSRA